MFAFVLLLVPGQPICPQFCIVTYKPSSKKPIKKLHKLGSTVVAFNIVQVYGRTLVPFDGHFEFESEFYIDFEVEFEIDFETEFEFKFQYEVKLKPEFELKIKF